jgi:hypothetical protein
MDLHGSSVDVRGSKEKDERCSIGCVLTQKPLMLDQTLRFMDQIVKIADVENLGEQEFIRSKLGVHEFEDLVEHYQGKWTRTKMKKGTKTASVRRRNMRKQPLATKTSRNDRPSYPGTHRKSGSMSHSWFG